MTVTLQHEQLAQKIDQWVKSIERKGGGDEQILQGVWQRFVRCRAICP